LQGITWEEGYGKWKEKTPEKVRDNLSEMIVEHKDSIYLIKHSHNGN